MPMCQQPSARSLGDGTKSTRRLKVNYLFIYYLCVTFQVAELLLRVSVDLLEGEVIISCNSIREIVCKEARVTTGLKLHLPYKWGWYENTGHLKHALNVPLNCAERAAVFWMKPKCFEGEKKGKVFLMKAKSLPLRQMCPCSLCLVP